MRKIFDYDENIFSPEVLEESQRLLNELGAIKNDTTQFDDEIRAADIKVKDALVVGATPVVTRDVNSELYRALGQKRMYKIQIDNRRNELLKGVEGINNPRIYYLRECFNETLSRLLGVTKYHPQTSTDHYTGKKSVKSSTNINSIDAIREILLASREKISTLFHSPLASIKKEIEAIDIEVNTINYSEMEVIQMSKQDSDDIIEKMKGTPSNNLPPGSYVGPPPLTEGGFLNQKWTELKKLTGWKEGREVALVKFFGENKK